MVEKQCKIAKDASYVLAYTDTAEKNAMLASIADALLKNADYILKENAKDLKNPKLDTVFIDRLMLNKERIDAMAEGVRQIIALPDPVGELVEEWSVKNGLRLSKVRAPIGVIGVIYEARPNVTVDVAALCIKSGNAVVLRGGKEAINSNRALYRTMVTALKDKGFETGMLQFIDDATRASTEILLKQDRYIDVIIPRGSDGLKQYILENSKIPVIASAGGMCHVYVEKSADLEIAEKIVINSKCNRPSVCNAAETLLVDKAIAKTFLPTVLSALKEKGVKLYGDSATRKIVKDVEPATDENYYIEYHDMIMNVKVVKDINEAIEHINGHNTKHTEAIVTSDKKAEELFTSRVDAAAVFVNASTRFTDGFEFGFGAEIAISTGKIHARGPLGLKELTCIRYIGRGNGQIRG